MSRTDMPSVDGRAGWIAMAAILALAILAWTVLRLAAAATGAPYWMLAVAYCAAGLGIAWLFERERS